MNKLIHNSKYTIDSEVRMPEWMDQIGKDWQDKAIALRARRWEELKNQKHSKLLLKR